MLLFLFFLFCRLLAFHTLTCVRPFCNTDIKSLHLQLAFKSSARRHAGHCRAVVVSIKALESRATACCVLFHAEVEEVECGGVHARHPPRVRWCYCGLSLDAFCLTMRGRTNYCMYFLSFTLATLNNWLLIVGWYCSNNATRINRLLDEKLCLARIVTSAFNFDKKYKIW